MIGRNTLNPHRNISRVPEPHKKRMRLWLFGGKKATSAVPRSWPRRALRSHASAATALAPRGLVPLASRRPARGASGMSARGVAPVAPLARPRVSMTASGSSRRLGASARSPAATGGDADGTGAPRPGRSWTPTPASRRRRRPPTPTLAGQEAGESIAGQGGAVFMGTIDLDDDALEDSLMRSLASRPDPSAVLEGTIDDGDLNIFATFDDIDAKGGFGQGGDILGRRVRPRPDGAATRPRRSSTTPPSSPPSRATSGVNGKESGVDGEESGVSGKESGVNAPEAVGRCNEVIRRCDSMDAVLSAVREMTNAGIEPTESTYVAVMLAARNNPSVGPGRAIDVYDAAMANGFAFSSRTFDLAMECAVRSKRVADALKIKEDMERAGHATTPRTYAVLLNLLVNTDVGKPRAPRAPADSHVQLFEEMLANNVAPPPAAFARSSSPPNAPKVPDFVARSFRRWSTRAWCRAGRRTRRRSRR